MTAVMILSKTLLIVAVLAIGFSYYLWTLMPSDLDQKGMAVFYRVFGWSYFPVVWVGSVVFGHKSEWETFRIVVKLSSPSPDLHGDPMFEISDDVFNGIPVRVYRPKGAPVPSPVIMYFYGGGWCFGNKDGADLSQRYMAKKTNVTHVLIDYRLAPENPFPAALDDCVAATLYVLENGQQHGFDTSSVALNGYSAGANLAAAVTLRLMDEEFQSRDLPPLKFLVLTVPTLQAVDLTLPSFLDNDEVYVVVSRYIMAFYIQNYAGLGMSLATTQQITNGQHIRQKSRSEFRKYLQWNLTKESKDEAAGPQDGETVNETLASLAEPFVLNHRFSPLLAPDDLLKRMPPTFIVVSHYDVVRDDGLLFGSRLRQAGVQATTYTIENGHHMSLIMLNPEPGSEAAEKAYEAMFRFINDHKSVP